MFDPWLTSSHRAIVVGGDNIIAHFEHHVEPRRGRKRKARDRENFAAIVRAILANLAFVVASELEPPTIGVSIRGAKLPRTRYDRPGFSALPKILAWLLAEGGLHTFTLTRSRQKGTASAIAPTQNFREELLRFKWTPEHFAEAPGRETIVLTRTQRDYAESTTTRELIDYRDDPAADHFRAEMAKVNALLGAADLRMADDGGPRVITSARRTLRRHFNLPADAPEGDQRFDLGGRLFGGWWQELPRERRASIRVAGEPVADLDFASMFLRLAYLEAGAVPPEGDLYARVQGLSEPRWRDGVKKVANAMLFRTTPLTRLPGDAKTLLPPRASGPEVRAAILTAFPPLEPVFETGAGLRLMFTESQVLMAALLRLVEKRVPALPMHDGLMVAQSKASVAAQAMLDAAEEVTGFRLPISLKTQYE